MSRALDAEVAEKVMGWHCDGEFNWRDENNVMQDWVDSWWPSTDIADAWQVVEKMQERGAVFGYQTIKEGVRGNFAWFGVLPTPASSFHEDFYGEGETAPLAICRAALEALT